MPCGCVAYHLRQQRHEALHPPQNAGMVDVNGPLGQKLFHVMVGESETQIVGLGNTMQRSDLRSS
jgi:hypothetical protein